LETLSPGQHFAGRNRQRRMTAQLDEAFQIVWRERLLEPDDVVCRQHLRCLESPFVAVRPELLAAAGIHHELDIWADRVARRSDEQFIGLPIAAAERPPAEFDGFEASRRRLLEFLAQWARFIE